MGAPQIMVNPQSAMNKERDTAEEARPRQSLGICYDYQNKGHCHRGAGCRWTHEEKKEQMNVCFEFQNRGTCGYGAQCRWRHIPKTGHALKHEFEAAVQPKQSVNQNQDQSTNDELQARLRLILGEAPNIPSFVADKFDNVDDGHKKAS